MGSPHRSGSCGSLGEVVEKMLKKLDFEANEDIFHDLRENGQALNFIQEEFVGLLESRAPFLTVYSLLEAKTSRRDIGVTEKVRWCIKIVHVRILNVHRLLTNRHLHLTIAMKLCEMSKPITGICVDSRNTIVLTG